MRNTDKPDPVHLLPELELWSEQLFKIGTRLQKIDFELADKGIIARGGPPAVNPGDSMAVVRLKEEAFSLRRGKSEVKRRMNAEGAILLDDLTGEIVVPGGPREDSYLSWMPGERTICWWRAEADTGSPRKMLPEIDPDMARPPVH